MPLRLLAREVYDRVVAAKGEAAAALITGEERIVSVSELTAAVKELLEDNPEMLKEIEAKIRAKINEVKIAAEA